ncbi:MAG: TetR family transcriptional regulator, partial [Photobacterium frigidiphilum]|uniref:TetR family transcriptional regulator n=1 Tax=Photobacterium frigidiphilum TaxID=264736 RepID=UPI00300148E5
GFHATGIDRIVAESGISKTTLFRHFESKDILIRDALAAFSQRIQMSWIVEECENAEAQLLARFDVLLELVNNNQFHGCVFLNASGEYPDEQSLIHQVAIAHKHASLAETQRLLAVIKGIERDVALTIELIYEGVVARLQVQQDTVIIEAAKKAVQLLLNIK